MGMHGLLTELPVSSMQSTETGFESLNVMLHNEKNPANVDVGTLVSICELTHRSTHKYGNYVPTFHEFQRMVALLTWVCG